MKRITKLQILFNPLMCRCSSPKLVLRTARRVSPAKFALSVMLTFICLLRWTISLLPALLTVRTQHMPVQSWETMCAFVSTSYLFLFEALIVNSCSCRVLSCYALLQNMFHKIYLPILRLSALFVWLSVCWFVPQRLQWLQWQLC